MVLQTEGGGNIMVGGKVEISRSVEVEEPWEGAREGKPRPRGLGLDGLALACGPGGRILAGVSDWIITSHLLENLSQSKPTHGNMPHKLEALTSGGVALLVQLKDKYSKKTPKQLKSLILTEKAKAQKEKIEISFERKGNVALPFGPKWKGYGKKAKDMANDEVASSPDEYEVLAPKRSGTNTSPKRSRTNTSPDLPARKRVQSSPARIVNKKKGGAFGFKTKTRSKKAEAAFAKKNPKAAKYKMIKLKNRDRLRALAAAKREGENEVRIRGSLLRGKIVRGK
ncbi:hypothetical protein TrCOL_g346 [Triparma columacea]|uniref:Uncharacterized protein n=1 Tax=Triparma columacea TaxID=722753 RepID=A0A9W7GEM8_9STRA|nr:hypothetical protein TrCOL_g346 [Triparma columacea]